MGRARSEFIQLLFSNIHRYQSIPSIPVFATTWRGDMFFWRISFMLLFNDAVQQKRDKRELFFGWSDKRIFFKFRFIGYRIEHGCLVKLCLVTTRGQGTCWSGRVSLQRATKADLICQHVSKLWRMEQQIQKSMNEGIILMKATVRCKWETITKHAWWHPNIPKWYYDRKETSGWTIFGIWNPSYIYIWRGAALAIDQTFLVAMISNSTNQFEVVETCLYKLWYTYWLFRTISQGGGWKHVFF